MHISSIGGDVNYKEEGEGGSVHRLPNMEVMCLGEGNLSCV